MTVRELIEMLAKGDWDAKVHMDPEVGGSNYDDLKDINSISAFTYKKESIVTLNTKTI